LQNVYIEEVCSAVVASLQVVLELAIGAVGVEGKWFCGNLLSPQTTPIP
jgi:hypothetical protein